MSATVVYLPEAESDLRDAYSAYEQQRSGLGDRFLAQLRHRVELISERPELYAVLRDQIRAAPLTRFPYVVYYRVEAGTVYILAVLHGHRNTEAWRNRG